MKLIRDKMPARKGKKRQEYLGEADPIYGSALLYAKFLEELAEYRLAQTEEAKLEELADLVTVIRGLAKIDGLNWTDVLKYEKEKAKKRGRFDNLTIMLDSKIH